MTMRLWEEIVQDHGQELLDLILTVYVNFYDSELEIIDICGRWMPRRKLIKEKIGHVFQAHDEVKHMGMFKKGVEALGFEWDKLDLDRYRVRDIGGRFEKLAESDDDLEIQIGMNMYAEGVLAMEELVQLGTHAPRYFPEFREIAHDQIRHVGYGKAIARRLIAESPENRALAQRHCNWYRDHLLHYMWEDITDLIDVAVRCGCASSDFRERTALRFEKVMGSLGLEVEWPDDLRRRIAELPSARPMSQFETVNETQG